MSENSDDRESKLVSELGSSAPNIALIVTILAAQPKLQTKIIESSTNGTALHIAARDDS